MKSQTMAIEVAIFHFTMMVLAMLATDANEVELERIMEKMTDDVLEYVEVIENEYQNRCSLAVLGECGLGNYDDCLSEYSGQTCPGGSFTVDVCGDGVLCGSFFDFSRSNLRMPASLARGTNNNPTDPKIIETVCYTRETESWMVGKYEQDRSFWESVGTIPPQTHFGALDGTFRIHPARHSKTCGAYDPRVRPWYVAGSSGPKDVILILDTSGSMDGLLLETMKEAAKTIVSTLTVGDRVSLIQFNTEASVIGSANTFVTATQYNKRTLYIAIDRLVASGKTNFFDAFREAFDVFDRSIEIERNSGCNAAILFFTDGEMTAPDGIDADTVVNSITARKTKVEEAIKRPVTIFTYSIGGGAVHTIPKRIACATDGLWSEIQDERFLVERMSNYYRLFALGLGVDENSDFAAWVEPYEFATGGWLGTTVSAPVYDRSVEPHIFLGVAGIDFTLTAIAQTLGESCTTESSCVATVKAISRRSTARCPTLNLTTCELESLRRQTGGDQALCTNECGETDFVGIEPKKCEAVSDYPRDLWENTRNKDKSYEDRVCCGVANEDPTATDSCSAAQGGSNSSDSSTSIGIIVGGIIGGVVLVALCSLVICRKSRCKGNHVSKHKAPATASAPSLPPPISPHFAMEEAASPTVDGSDEQ